MKHIEPSPNEHHWPRNKVASVDCRKRDLVIRIANWMNDKDEPAYDVETYIGGVYDWHKSQCFTRRAFGKPSVCKAKAIEYAQKQIAKLL